jgi:hypothetical protein
LVDGQGEDRGIDKKMTREAVEKRECERFSRSQRAARVEGRVQTDAWFSIKCWTKNPGIRWD